MLEKRIRVLICMLVCPWADCVTAQEMEFSPWNFSFATELKNQDVWRGFLESPAPTATAVAEVCYRGFALTAESVFSKHPELTQSWLEAVIQPSYTHRIGDVDATVGWRYTRVPALPREAGNATQEGYLQVERDGLLHPSYTIFRDVQLGSGWYHYLSFSQPVRLRGSVVLEPSVGAGLNQHLFITQTTVSDVNLGVRSVFRVSRSTWVEPFYTYTFGHRTLFGRHHVAGVVISLDAKSRARR